MAKSKGQVQRRLRKQARKELAKSKLFVIPATKQEHLNKARSLWEQAANVKR